MNEYVTVRGAPADPREALVRRFSRLAEGPSDAVFADSGATAVAGVVGLAYPAPVMGALFAIPAFAEIAERLFRQGKSLLVAASPAGPAFHVHGGNGVQRLPADEPLARAVGSVIAQAATPSG
jgi:hypothetical protein